MAQFKPSYKDDDYNYTNHTDEIYKGIYNLWPGVGPMPHKKVELEGIFFTGSDFVGNIIGSNFHPKREYPTVLREHKRRLTSSAPDNESKESLEVVVQRVSKFLLLLLSHVELVLRNLIKMKIKSNHDLCIALHNVSNTPHLLLAVMCLIKDKCLSLYKEGLFLKCASFYMQ